MTYDRPIYILTPSTQKNALNEKLKDHYAVYGFRFAKATFQGGRESYQARQLVGTNDVVFTIPYEPNISQSMVVKYNGIYYNIVSVAEEGRALRLHIVCSARDRKDTITVEQPVS